MAAIPFPPANTVTTTAVDYLSVLANARQGPEEAWIEYTFGNNAKIFWSNFETDTFYDKPVSIAGGVTTHLHDPELISTNP
jgi:hypothetical protein